MDWQFKFGVGLGVFFGLLGFVVKDLPQWVTFSGMAIGVIFMAWGVYSKWKTRPKDDLEITVGVAEPQKIVNRSDHERHEFVRAVIRSSRAFHECMVHDKHFASANR